MKIYHYLKNFLFPGFCAMCGESLINVSEIRHGLCEKCAMSINPESGDKCGLCGKPLISEIEICLSCRNGYQHSFDRQWVLFPYTGKYRTLMQEYKFRKKLALAEFFTDKVMDVLKDCEFNGAHIVPVPPRPGKIKDSGWDQVDYLVKRLAKRGINVSRCLKRRESKIQKRLNRTERMENLKGKIYQSGTPPKTAVVIDDITTTGSTIEVCSSVLKEAGTEKVYSLCLFYD